MKTTKYYCWREVEVETGYLDQYLDQRGIITNDSGSRAYFASEDEAQSHCEAHSEPGEQDFTVQFLIK